jgi:hypothetical protein
MGKGYNCVLYLLGSCGGINAIDEFHDVLLLFKDVYFFGFIGCASVDLGQMSEILCNLIFKLIFLNSLLLSMLGCLAA